MLSSPKSSSLPPSGGGETIRSLAHRHLNSDQRKQLKVCIKSFQQSRSVVSYCAQLKTLLDGNPGQIEILEEMYKVMPQELQGDFNELCILHFGDNYIKKFNNNNRVLKNSQKANSNSRSGVQRKRSKRRERTQSAGFNLIGSGGNQPTRNHQRRRTTASSRSPLAATPSTMARKVELEHRPAESLGLCIRGGADQGCGVFISEVDEGSQAQEKGLRAGERILSVNGTSFRNLKHTEAVQVLMSKKLIVYVAPLGQMPGPPRQPKQPEIPAPPKAEYNKKGERSVTVVADEDGWLGCTIKGGGDCNCPASVASVDLLSPSYLAGLRKGELVLKVNGKSVKSMKHLDIVNLIASTSPVVLRVKKPTTDDLDVSVKRAFSLRTKSPTSPNAAPSQIYRQVRRSNSSPPQRFLYSGQNSPSMSGRQGALMTMEEELQSTPPQHTSTPLPPSPPALPTNRSNNSKGLEEKLDKLNKGTFGRNLDKQFKNLYAEKFDDNSETKADLTTDINGDLITDIINSDLTTDLNVADLTTDINADITSEPPKPDVVTTPSKRMTVVTTTTSPVTPLTKFKEKNGLKLPRERRDSSGSNSSHDSSSWGCLNEDRVNFKSMLDKAMQNSSPMNQLSENDDWLY